MSRTSRETDVLERSRTEERIRTPRQFKVIMLNDDYTSMEFVVFILESVFSKTRSEATRIMLQVHKKGKGVCGIYSRQIAEAKIAQVHTAAQREGYPLRAIMEPVEGSDV